MVFCCVPFCESDSWNSGPLVSFHEFPSNPDLSAKWIQQINVSISSKQTWFPDAHSDKPMICSRHFLPSDFVDDSCTLKLRAVPTQFGFNDGANHKNHSPPKIRSPWIVNLIKPSNSSDPPSQNAKDENEHSKTLSPVSPFSEKNKQISYLDPMAQKKSIKIANNKTYLLTNQNKPSYRSQFKLGYKIQRIGSKSPSKFVKPDINKFVVEKPSPVVPKLSMVNGNMIQKRNKAKTSAKTDLIEIGPSTFLKINPEVIKVNKKLTPSGNTVLQFVMDQKLANSQNSADLLPKLVHGTPSVHSEQQSEEIARPSSPEADKESSPTKSKEPVVQHVLGHLVDIHVCKDSCAHLQDTHPDHKTDDEVHESDDMELDDESFDDPGPSTSAPEIEEEAEKPPQPQNILNKAPVLFTTNLQGHCMLDRPKFVSQLKQKSRQISQLKFKVASLTKKIEELEDKCIVQERQLSYSFIKRLKTIRKNANKGDSCATYILEQIRCYAGKNKMRWSDSTLSQCAIWCRKAPYAYEYFKKADFFKLPCLGTVKRFMKKHPELKYLSRAGANGSNPNDDESSSDFDFDDSESEKGAKGNSDIEDGIDAAAETATMDQAGVSAQPTENHFEHYTVQTPSNQVQNRQAIIEQTSTLDKEGEMAAFPMTVDGSNLEVQELILPSGEVVQCYSSNGTDLGSQYYIIPNVDQTSGGEHEYNVIQASDSIILQNLENVQLPLQQDQLIFISNSADQLECTETEVITDSI